MEKRSGSPGGRAANLIPLDAGGKAKTLAMLCEKFASFGGRSGKNKDPRVNQCGRHY